MPRIFRLIYQYFCGFHYPVCLQLQGSHFNAFSQIFKPEPAGFTTGFSGSHLAARSQRFHHPFNIVITFRRLLPFTRTNDAVRG